MLQKKETYILQIWNPADPDSKGIGEAGPLPKLSLDDIPDFEIILDEYASGLVSQSIPWTEEGIVQ